MLWPDPHTPDASGLYQAFLIVADAIAILHARARNREDEPDATFPPVLVILDDYDRILRLAEDAAQLEQLRRSVRQLIHDAPATEFTWRSRPAHRIPCSKTRSPASSAP